MAFMQASPAERTAFLNAIGLTAILAALPPSFRIEIQRRVAGRGAASEFDQFEAPKTATNALRKALSLEKIARLPGISPAMANANKTEALAALKWITDLVDLNDLVLMITEAAVAKRCRRAA